MSLFFNWLFRSPPNRKAWLTFLFYSLRDSIMVVGGSSPEMEEGFLYALLPFYPFCLEESSLGVSAIFSPPAVAAGR